MKCVRCGIDSRYRERPNRQCKSCGEPFAFEPRGAPRDPITDLRFDRALVAVSEGGTVRWSMDHLYYEVCRRVRRAWAFSGVRRAQVPFDRARFDAICERWRVAHGSGTPPVPARGRETRVATEPYGSGLEADIGTYTFDRAVVCDQAATVDLLLANRFHIDNRCAVVSADGHPTAIFATVLEMIKRSPSLDVIAVHDASPWACELPRWLAEQDSWFRSEISAGTVRLVDAGLRPSQTRKLKGCYVANSQPVPPGVYPPKDAKWLERHNCELAAVRPGRTLRYLRRLVVSPPPPGTGGADSSDLWVIADGDDGDDDGFG